jgi:hypothetical protein
MDKSNDKELLGIASFYGRRQFMKDAAIGTSGAWALLASWQARATPTITNNTAAGTVTITGTNYALVFNYNLKAVITSYQQGSVQYIGAFGGGAGGIFSAVLLNNTTWVTSQSLPTNPIVTVTASTVTATFSTSVADETWTFVANDAFVTFQLSRTYTGSYNITEQGTPVIDLAQTVSSNIRWTEDGGNWPVEPAGPATGYFPAYWIGSTSGNRTETRISKEQISFSILNNAASSALQVLGTSSASGVLRGHATVANRLPDSYGGYLRLFVHVANAGLSYVLTPTMPDGSIPSSTYYSCAVTAPPPQGYWGHTSTRSETLFAGISANAGDTVWSELTFQPDNYTSYYNLGTLVGLPSVTNLSQLINDYGRFAITDKAQAGYFEGPNWRSELVASEMHWLAQLIDTFPSAKPGAVGALKGGLSDIRDYLQTSDGHVYTGTTTVIKSNSWGRNLSDSQSGFVLGVVNAYYMSGDSAWLSGMKVSCENALNYALSAYADPSTRLTRVDVAAYAPTLLSNEYWEAAWFSGKNDPSCIGKPNGYTSAMLYDAMTRWALIEGSVLGDSTNAAYYSGIAATMQSSYNADITAGGAWLSSINAPMFSTTTAAVHYLPVIGAALKSNLLSPARRQAAAIGYLRACVANGVAFLVNNVYDLGNASVLADYNHLGTDGGLYGCAAGDGYAVFIAAKDRVNAKAFTNAWISVPPSNWYGGSWFLRDGTISTGPEGHDNDFPSTANMAWGFYHYILGFQPSSSGLTIAPFIWSDLVGSTATYEFLGQQIVVNYQGIDQFQITIPSGSSGSTLTVRWPGQAANSPYTVKAGVTSYSVTSDGDGYVNWTLSGPGTYVVQLVDADEAVLVMDNDGPGWASGGTPAFNDTSATVEAEPMYGGSERYAPAGTGAQWSSFTPNFATAGNYKVYAYWTDNANRASNVPYTIYFNGGPQVVRVDQRSNGGRWNYLGTFNFNAGTTGNNLYISNDANGWVMMDAVKFVPA